MFADNTNLFYTNKNIEALFETVSEEMHYANEWFRVVYSKQFIS